MSETFVCYGAANVPYGKPCPKCGATARDGCPYAFARVRDDIDRLTRELTEAKATLASREAEIGRMRRIENAAKRLNDNINEFGEVTDGEFWDDLHNALADAAPATGEPGAEVDGRRPGHSKLVYNKTTRTIDTVNSSPPSWPQIRPVWQNNLFLAGEVTLGRIESLWVNEDERLFFARDYDGNPIRDAFPTPDLAKAAVEKAAREALEGK